MFSALASTLKYGASLFSLGTPIGFKAIKYFVDSTFREKVVPVPGSVLYCDLWYAVEHSGIYVGDEKISNIVVDGWAESTVEHSSPLSFTSKSKLGRKIYVSCNQYGAVGNLTVARGANSHVGERAFYGLVIKNCHQFSTKCVNYVDQEEIRHSMRNGVLSTLQSETWEPTLGILKSAAREKLGATKWRLWDWENNSKSDTSEEPDWEMHNDFFRQQPLNDQIIAEIRTELAAAQAYGVEINDEEIPSHIRQRLEVFRKTLTDISEKYDEVKGFLAVFTGASFTYAELQACDDDFSELAKTLKSNIQIKELAMQMGRNYISEKKKKQTRIPQASKSEVHGTHRSDDVMRMLPSELLNLEDEDLEVLFYARLLEKNLMTYELQGVTLVDDVDIENSTKRTGPIVACLDTSGSMQGAPLLKAKALLLAISNILKQENRSLHVLLFGSTGEISEFSMDRENSSSCLLKFLKQSYAGGTDFEAPLMRAFEIIESRQNFIKADIFMISDGDCHLSPEFLNIVKVKKTVLNCSIYTVLCAGERVKDSFSDEIVVL